MNGMFCTCSGNTNGPASSTRMRRLHVRIENEAGQESFTRFRPHSITERAAALGGRAQVRQCESGGTAVLVEIPI